MEHKMWSRFLALVVGVVLLGACAQAYAIEAGQGYKKDG